MNCPRTGCDGQIEDGYCNACGLAPPVAAIASSAASEQSTSHDTGSTPTRGRTTGTTLSRGHLGAGLVEVPPVPYRDPASVLLDDPQVAESKRFCGKCETPVGRTRGDRPGRVEGFCPQCGTTFSFAPKLGPGDLVAGQYQVAGCLAHGGLGWIYLAQDRNVSDRWVVLKGLLDTGDESAMAAAIAERRFLAQVEHPNIVRIYNFVEHLGSGYIVMEYVGGPSLKDLRRDPATGATRPLAVTHAIAYMIESLPALGYLHTHDLLYCDFKPDNVIQTEEQLKLIDLGGVRRSDDETSDLYGTVGYQAPEVAEDGPSVASDLYTVARTLAVLTFDFRGFQDPDRFAYSLPGVEQIPVFARYPAVHRFLAKGTHPDRQRRFTSAAEMAEQLVGVLRQVIAIDGGRPRPAPSALFTPELGADPQEPSWRLLPIPAVDPVDPAAGILAGLAAASPEQVINALESAPPSPDVDFQRARALLELNDLSAAAGIIESRAAVDALDWRTAWWQGVVLLAGGDAAGAHASFTWVSAEVPGELAPVLAVGVAAELKGDNPAAAAAYELVAATDPSYSSAVFGLARVRTRQGDRRAAAGALRRISPTSSAHTAAQAALCTVLSETSSSGRPGAEDLSSASDVLAGFTGDLITETRLTRDLLIAALTHLNGDGDHPTVRLAGVDVQENDVRTALEQACRELAKLAPSEEERIALVDEANAFRPRTLW